jgi:hypothetical protein
MNDSVMAKKMVRIGVWSFSLTWLKYLGRAPSRANAYIMRELAVREKRPQCQTQTMICDVPFLVSHDSRRWGGMQRTYKGEEDSGTSLAEDVAEDLEDRLGSCDRTGHILDREQEAENEEQSKRRRYCKSIHRQPPLRGVRQERGTHDRQT